MRPAVLQPRVHDAAGAAGGPLQVQVPLVLLRGVRGVCSGRSDLNLQLNTVNLQLDTVNLQLDTVNLQLDTVNLQVDTVNLQLDLSTCS